MCATAAQVSGGYIKLEGRPDVPLSSHFPQVVHTSAKLFVKMATVVIVPGSFSPPTSYNVFAGKLAQEGIASAIVDLPSVGRREGKPPQTMSDDVSEISRVVSRLADEGKEVILMTHSYGGIPGTQSLETLSHKARSSEGKPGGIKKIVYLTSVILSVGVSNLDTFGGSAPDFLTVEVGVTSGDTVSTN